MSPAAAAAGLDAAALMWWGMMVGGELTDRPLILSHINFVGLLYCSDVGVGWG